MNSPERWRFRQAGFLIVSILFSSLVLPTGSLTHNRYRDVRSCRRYVGTPLAAISGDTDSQNRHEKGDAPILSSVLTNRRACIASITSGTSVIVAASSDHAKASDDNSNSIIAPMMGADLEERDDSPVTISLPLEPASGGTFCVRCTVFDSNDGSSVVSSASDYASNFRIYRAIVDTGSPYLVLPSSGIETESITKSSRLPSFSLIDAFRYFGFSFLEEEKSLSLSNSEYPPTQEIYGSVKGQIDWKMAQYSFRDPRLNVSTNTNINGLLNQSASPSAQTSAGVVGVLDDVLTNEATGGGIMEPFALLGLIRNSNQNADKIRFPDPRPTFFEQECITNDIDSKGHELKVQSFSLNGPLRELSLSTGSLIPDSASAMPLVDLRPYGDFVDHYAVLLDSVSFDGVSVSSRQLKEFSGDSIERPIVAVFDTGLTGCLLIRPFWDAVQKVMREKHNIMDEDGKVSIHEFQSVSVSVHELTTQQTRSKIDRTDKNDVSICKIESSSETNPRLFYVNPIDLDWFDNGQSSPYVIVLGQAFLSTGLLTIDMNKRFATFTA